MSLRGPYAKGLATRTRIFEVALQQFTKEGYDRTSVREIARAAGITQAGLLHHFPDKRTLFLELIKWYHVRNIELHGAEERPLELLMSTMERNAREPGLARLFVLLSAESTDDDGPVHEFFCERYRRAIDLLAADLRDRQERGEIDSRWSADDLASLLVAAADGLQLQWLLDPDSTDVVGRLSILRDAAAVTRPCHHGARRETGES